MTRKLLLTLTLLSFSALLPISLAQASPSGQSLVIKHQLNHCHSWALNGGLLKTSQLVTLAKGQSLLITDNDLMPHTIIKLQGPAVTYTKAAYGSRMMGAKGIYPASTMSRMGASSRITFTHRGVYTFTTKSGEDYMPIRTVGEDHILKLTVKVS